MIDIEINEIKPWPVFEPKKSNRFILRWIEPFNIPDWVSRSIKNIGYTSGEWDVIQIELYDPIVPSTSIALIAGIEESKKNSKEIVHLQLQQLGPVGDVTETWDITGLIMNIDFGNLDWEADEEIKTITVKFKPLHIQVA